MDYSGNFLVFVIGVCQYWYDNFAVSQEMKLIFTTSGNNLDALLDPSFGRARNFLLYDLESGASQVMSNQQNLNAAQGAGIQAAQTIAKAGAGALVTGHCGPKAFRVLAAAGIKVYNTDAPTISEALARFRAGQLTEAASANVESHWA
jgi:predicted Fe-Mo cluster-binding NifX family protein